MVSVERRYYSTHQKEAMGVVAEARTLGAEAFALKLDVGDLASFPDFIGDVRGHLERLGTARFDYLVNNAGVGMHKPYEAVTESDLDKLIAVHIKGPFFLTQQLLPLMADGGRIVNISSGLTRFCFPGAGSYALVKGAVEVFTRYLAKEYGARGARTRDDPKVNKAVSDGTALGRPGQADDVAPVIVSLLSDESRWVNAQRIEVSGGMLL